jgi:hypothetical protein
MAMSGRIVVLCIAIIFAVFGYTHPVVAAIVTELEVNGTATNNSIATAQFIPASAFTLPVPANVFNPPGFPTATVFGLGGLSCRPFPACSAPGVPPGLAAADTDFYSFFANGGQVLLDIDNHLVAAGDFILILYNSAGQVLSASFDGSCDDPGTITIHDPMIGGCLETSSSFSGPAPPNTYFVPPSSPGGSGFLVFPFLLPGPGQYYVQVRTESSFDVLGPQPILPTEGYRLEISVQNIPAPGSLYLLGFGLAGITLFGAIVRKHESPEGKGAEAGWPA